MWWWGGGDTSLGDLPRFRSFSSSPHCLNFAAALAELGFKPASAARGHLYILDTLGSRGASHRRGGFAPVEGDVGAGMRFRHGEGTHG